MGKGIARERTEVFYFFGVGWSILYRTRFLGQFLVLFGPTSWSCRSEIAAPEPNVCVVFSSIVNNAVSPAVMLP
jgi:hypothetical protein